MKAEYVNAYVLATKQLLEVMFNINQFKHTLLRPGTELDPSYDVSAVIGVAGECTGAVVLSFTQEVAIKMVSQLMGEPIDTFDEDTCDALGEMVNIIAGNANRELEKFGVGKLSMSVPTVLVGKEHKVKNPKNIPCIGIDFDTDLGKFAIQVSLECL